MLIQRGGGTRRTEGAAAEEVEQGRRRVLEHGAAAEAPVGIRGPDAVPRDDGADLGGRGCGPPERDRPRRARGHGGGDADPRAQVEVGVHGAVELGELDGSRCAVAAQPGRGERGVERVGRGGIRMRLESGARGLADRSELTLIVLAALVLIYGIVMNRTVFGRHIYAIGGNRHAAELSGIKTRRVDFWLFVNMGVLAALAGLIFTARLNLAGPKAGDGFELEAISAAFIGGAAVQGGVGTIGGAIIGGLIIGVLNNGMSIMGIGIEWQQAVKGLVLLLAVAFDVYNKRRSGRS